MDDLNEDQHYEMIKSAEEDFVRFNKLAREALINRDIKLSKQYSAAADYSINFLNKF